MKCKICNKTIKENTDSNKKYCQGHSIFELASEVEDYGNSVVASNIPDSIDPYDMLQYCENVEHEGGKQFRFDGVYSETKKELIELLKKRR